MNCGLMRRSKRYRILDFTSLLYDALSMPLLWINCFQTNHHEKAPRGELLRGRPVIEGLRMNNRGSAISRWFRWRRHPLAVESTRPSPRGGERLSLHGTRPIPTGYVMLRLKVLEGQANARVLADVGGVELLLLLELSHLQPGRRHDRLLWLPLETQRLILEVDGSTQLGSIRLEELGAAPLVATLARRWLVRQLGTGGRRPTKLANAARVLFREGPRAAHAGLLAAQASSQDVADFDLSDAIEVLHARQTRFGGSQTRLPGLLKARTRTWSRARSLSRVRSMHDRRCEANLAAFLASDQRFSFSVAGRPRLSIIVVTFDRAELTLACLRSIAAHAGDVELVVVDNASTDDTLRVLDRIDGATVLRNAANLGFLNGCKQGVKASTGDHVLLLNNDLVLEREAVTAMMKSLTECEPCGVVGGALIALDGALQEAGGIVWEDGACEGYGRGDDPGLPQYRFRRDVDFASGAFLLTPRAVWEKLEGFDDAFTPAYYEDVDYCLRARAAGYRVVFEPHARAVHYEHAGSSAGHARSLMLRNRETLRKRHDGYLATRYPRSHRNRLLAREARRDRRRVLFIDDRVPLPQFGSGAPRAAAILRALVELGFEVTFFPTLPWAGTWEDITQAVPREVEMYVGPEPPSLRRFLSGRRSYYDDIIVSRTHNLAAVERIRRREPDLFSSSRLIYDAEAISALRERAAQRFRLATPLRDDPMEPEMSLARAADLVLSVSATERDVLRQRGVTNVEIVAHGVAPLPSDRTFSQREGFLFVGSLTQDGSPNVDSMAWFLNQVWPVVRQRLGNVRLRVAGRLGSLRLGSNRDGIEFLGGVDDLEPLYEKARVFIAPTRFSAGIPIKVYEASARGLPVVATDLLAGQLAWSPGCELLAAPVGDAAAFADQCVLLYSDEKLWRSLSERARRRTETECSLPVLRASLDRALAARPGRASRGTGAVRFLIVCPARTGSTMLAWYLRDHPDVCMHGEVFAPKGPVALDGLEASLGEPLEEALRAVRDREPVRFLHDVVFVAADRCAVGFKFKYEELSLRRWAKVRRALADDTDLRVIHLSRENLLGRYLSQFIATQVTHVFNLTSPNGRADVPPVVLDRDDCLADFQRIEAREHEFRALFARHPTIDVKYEELVASPERSLAQIQDFLGLELRTLRSKTERLETRSLTEAIVNHDDLERSFAGTKYERFFAG